MYSRLQRPIPYTLAAFWIVQSTGVSCNDLFTFLKCFNHQCNLAVVEMLRGINEALNFCFLILSEVILPLSNSLEKSLL